MTRHRAPETPAPGGGFGCPAPDLDVLSADLIIRPTT